MIPKRTIAILATLDTKGEEAAFLAERLSRLDCSALIVDIGPLGPPGVAPDVDHEEVARLGGWNLAELLATGERDRIMDILGKGAGALLSLLFSQGRIHGAIGLGGNQGTAVSAAAMRGLPFGFPKLLVSTVASGNIRPYVGHKDILTVFSVGDFLGGANPIIAAVLANAAAAAAGMAKHGEPMRPAPGKGTIAVTALGNTEKAASRAVKTLRAAGFEAVAFHASGAGGSAMEELIAAGLIQGVLDLTPHELIEEVAGFGIYQPVLPGRMTAAGARGIPQVVSTGGLEYLCFGPRPSIPPALRRRRITMHNPVNANVKASHGEMARAGAVMAQRLGAAQGPVAVLIPRRGWSVYGAPGGIFADPAGSRCFIRSLRENLRPGIDIAEIDAAINDEAFADACVDRLITFMKEQKEPS